MVCDLLPEKKNLLYLMLQPSLVVHHRFGPHQLLLKLVEYLAFERILQIVVIIFVNYSPVGRQYCVINSSEVSKADLGHAVFPYENYSVFLVLTHLLDAPCLGHSLFSCHKK